MQGQAPALEIPFLLPKREAALGWQSRKIDPRLVLEQS